MTQASRPDWICCQLSAREHYAMPRAIHKAGRLEKLITDFWFPPSSPMALNVRMRGRYHSELAGAAVVDLNLPMLAFEMGAHVRNMRRVQMHLARNRRFQALVAERLGGLADGARTVMAYSYSAHGIFAHARARGWRTVLAQIDPGPSEDARFRALSPDLQADSNDEAAFAQYWSLWREECALADVIVVNSQWSRSALVETGVPPSKIAIIPLAYAPPAESRGFVRTYPSSFSPDRPLRALFLGQVIERKGVRPLFDAIAKLSGLPIRFDFVGSVGVAIPEHIARNPAVRFHGNVARADVQSFYRDADIFLFPTYSDGFGITQLEARAWKLPIVASKFCGEVVEDGWNGLVLDKVDGDSIALAVHRLLVDIEATQSLADAEDGLARFSLDAIGARWLALPGGN